MGVFFIPDLKEIISNGIPHFNMLRKDYKFMYVTQLTRPSLNGI